MLRIIRRIPLRPNYSWLILLAGFIILFFNSGSRFTFGLMLKPMSEDLGWTRGSLTVSVTSFMVISALAMPIYGRLIDRYSLRLILAISVVTASLGLTLVSFVKEPWQFLICYGVVFAVGHAGFSISTISVMIGRWFPKRPGIANSIAISGNGVGQLIIVAIIASLLLSQGWRFSYVVLSVATIALVLPLIVILVRSNPPSASYSGYSESTERISTEAIQFTPSVGKSIISREYILLVILYAICGFQDFFVATHITSFASDNNVSPEVAGNLLALMGLAALVGVILSGVLSDRYGAKMPTTICFVIRVVIFILIGLSLNPPTIVAVTLIYGFTFLITAPLTVVFIRRIFGPLNMGTLMGGINMVHQVGGAIGAFAGGVVFDVTGSYRLIMLIMIGLATAGAITVSLLREQPIKDTKE